MAERIWFGEPSDFGTDLLHQHRIDSVDVGFWVYEFLSQDKDIKLSNHSDGVYKVKGLLDARVLGGHILSMLKKELE